LGNLQVGYSYSEGKTFAICYANNLCYAPVPNGIVLRLYWYSKDILVSSGKLA